MLSQDIINEFAPTGKLRVALNHGNRILVGRNDDGAPKGISVDLATGLAAELGLDIDFVHFDRAVDVSSTATVDLWDICFLAVDPKRAEVIDFTDPYVAIEGRYLASASCDAADAEALVRSGAKVGTVIGSAYTLTLERKEGAENLVKFAKFQEMMAALDAGKVAAAAGIGAVMAEEGARRAGTRILSPAFMEIRQAMAIVKGRDAAAAFLRAWVQDAARAGRTGDILEAYGVSRDCAVVPA